MIGEVRLEGAEFFARHGYYDAEMETGNRYEVAVSVRVPMGQAAEADRLSGTIDYEGLYEIAAEVMGQPTRLLERLAYRIARRVLETYPEALSVMAEVKKHNPPISGLCRAAAISLEMKREDLEK